jgi:hypothetical protein
VVSTQPEKLRGDRSRASTIFAVLPDLPARGSAIVVAAVVAAGLAVGAVAAPAQIPEASSDLVREPAIAYFTAPVSDPVAELNSRLQSGAVRLTFDDVRGYLPSVLDALQLPAASQVMVFSKTSVQAMRISPANPRAIYFNDTVSLGYIHNAEYLEFAAQDPRQGVIFYTLDQRRRSGSDGPPVIERRDFCLQCHNGNATSDVPGMVVRSIVTMPNGQTAPRFGNSVSDHRSPFEERWAGWYVTGAPASFTHLGNALLTDRDHPENLVTPETVSVTSLESRIDARAYLSPYSEVAALLTFNHQMHAMNLLTRVGWEARLAASRPQPDRARLFGAMANELVDYLLFVDEPPLPSAVKVRSGFAETFAALGPTDRRGRSLRELDLDTRLLRYPCSYMIYSPAFDALPGEAKDAVYRRLWQVLTGDVQAPRYQRLSAQNRQAIIEIVRDTKRDLPTFFQSSPR